MTVDYNLLIRNKLKDFIESRNWSVSRFAGRYVTAYAELFSRQEAPSRSTARKLVDEDGHVFTEKEVKVLDSFTGMDFYHTWLEGEKAKLIERTNKYLGDKSEEATIDSPAIFADTLRKMSRKDAKTTLDDIAEIVRRYMALNCDRPLVFVSTSGVLLHAAFDVLPPLCEVAVLHPETLIEDVKPHLRQKCICRIQTDSSDFQESLSEIFGDELFSLRLDWSGPMTESIVRKTGCTTRSDEAFVRQYMVKKCCEVRSDWPELFKEMMMTSANLPWIKFPPLAGPDKWMVYLDKKYKQFQSILSGELSEELAKLIAEKRIPEYWFADGYNPERVLRCLSVFRKWKLTKLHSIDNTERATKALENVEQIDLESLLLLGEPAVVDCESWLDERFNVNLVYTDLHKLIDVINVKEIRAKRK